MSESLRCKIVTSYKRSCGIAQYVEHLMDVLCREERVQFAVSALPVELLRSTSGRAKKLGNRKFSELIDEIKTADVVNIQYEPGLLGVTPFQVFSRLLRLLYHSRKIIITFHTVPATRPPRLSLNRNSIKAWLNQKFIGLLHGLILGYGKYAKNKFHYMVHTEREAERLEFAGIERDSISNHPLSFISKENKILLQELSAKTEARAVFGVNEGEKMIGIFGFLSPYKGVDVAIKAMKLLPPNYKLYIFGAVHPEAIGLYSKGTDYVQYLQDSLRSTSGAIDASLYKRVIFAGDQDNHKFALAMSACDSVVLPYIEVGQTSSGPAAIALDLQKPIYLTNNHCFRELAKYAESACVFFDVGNYIQLAQQIELGIANQKELADGRAAYSDKYTVEKVADTYARVCELLAATNKY